MKRSSFIKGLIGIATATKIIRSSEAHPLSQAPYKRGDRVFISKLLPCQEPWWEHNVDAIIVEKGKTPQYYLLILSERPHTVAWYAEEQLEPRPSDKIEGWKLLEKYGT